MPQHKWDAVAPPPRDLVRPVTVDPAGRTGPTRGQAQGPRWRRSSHGYYVPAHVDRSVPEQRILEESVRLPPCGAVTGWASCRMHRANFFDGLATDGTTELPVPLCTGPLAQLTETAATTVSRERLLADEIVTILGLPCTREQRGLFDAMRTAPDLRESVVAMDMMAAAQLVSVDQMRDYVRRHPGWKGVSQVRAALDLASEYSRSPNETRMRLVWQVDAGLPRPRMNQPVFDRRGRLLGIADLLDPVAGVAGEYDGADHRSVGRHSHDIDKEDLFRRHGLEVFRVTGPHLRDRERLVRRMQAARARARWLSPERAGWTITPPLHWEVQPGLDAILEQRRVWAEIYAEQERQASGM